MVVGTSGSRYDFPGVDHEGRQTCRTQLYIISYSIHHSGTDIKLCSYFSGVSCRQSFLAVMLAVIMLR